MPGLGFRMAEKVIEDLNISYGGQIEKRKSIVMHKNEKGKLEGVLSPNIIGNVVLPFFYILKHPKIDTKKFNYMDCTRIHNLEMKEFALTILKIACNNSKIKHKDKNYTEI